jgi:hypothetical protein
VILTIDRQQGCRKQPTVELEVTANLPERHYELAGKVARAGKTCVPT